MSLSRIVTTTAAVSALAVAGTAGAALAPTVSAQKAWTGARAPLTVPGTGLKKGARIPAGGRLVYRDVAISRGQTIRFRFNATGSRRLRGLVPGNSQVGFAVVRPNNYAGKRSVLVRAFAAPRTKGRVIGRIYAYLR